MNGSMWLVWSLVGFLCTVLLEAAPGLNDVEETSAQNELDRPSKWFSADI